MPIARKDYPDIIYTTEAGKFRAVCQKIKEISATEKYYCDNYDICIDLLKKTVKEKEVLLVLGAGKINDLAYQLAKK